MKLNREQTILEMVMIKYGMVRERHADGEEYLNFENFDLEGFKKNAAADMARIKQIIPLNEEWNISGSPYANDYRAAFIKELHRQAREQHTELPDGFLNLMVTAYNQGLDEGGNFVIKVFNGEIEPKV